MIASVHVLANPLGALARILYANQSFIGIEEIKPKGVRKKDLEFLTKKALEKQKNTRFISSMEKYRLYMENIEKNFARIKNRKLIFLDLENLCLEDRHGRFARECIDDFSTRTETANYLMMLYSKMPDSVKQQIREMVFYRLSPYDFPFMIGEEQELGLMIYNPFGDIAEKVTEDLATKGKSGLGDFQRYLKDDSTKGNYAFSKSIFSVSAFRELTRHFGYLEVLFKNYCRHEQCESETQISLEEFARLNEAAIRINREVMIQKYSSLFSSMEIKNITAYMLQGDTGLGLLNTVCKKTNTTLRIPGLKLLSQTKNRPARGILEPSALNRLSGWLTAQHGKGVSVIVKKEKYAPEIKHERSMIYPGVRVLGKENVNAVEAGIDSMDKEKVNALWRDQINYGYELSPIEDILFRLNSENFEVWTEQGMTQWQTQIKGSRVHPLRIADIEKHSQKFIRPSNAGAKCELFKYIQYFKGANPEFFKIAGQTKASKIGDAIHHISNKLPGEQHKVLEQHGLKALPREEYCEVAIIHEYMPSEKDWTNAEAEINDKIAKTGNTFYMKMLERLASERNRNTAIIDGGHPDAVAIVENTDELVVIDFKRRMRQYYPTPYFFEQSARYALAIMQNKNIDDNNFYSVIVQTPFSPNKILLMEAPDDGHYRKQKITIMKIASEGSFMEKVKTHIILEYIGNTLIHEDLKLGMHLRDLYKDMPASEQTASCSNCFANSEEAGAYECHVLMTGKKEPWENVITEN